MLIHRRPKIRKLAQHSDAKRLVKALGYSDHVVDSHGRMFDLGAATRRDAALALVGVADTETNDIGAALIQALGDSSGEVRRAAAVALGARREGRAVEALTEAALTWEEGPSGEPRQAACRALADLSGPECAEAVVRVVTDVRAEEGRARAVVETLAQRGGAETIEHGSDAAVAALASDDEDIVRRAGRALVWLGGETVGALIQALDNVPAAAAVVLDALGDLRDLKATGAVARRLGDERVDVRVAAASALGRIADPRSAPALVEATNDPDARVRDAALAALRVLGPLAAVPDHARQDGFADPGSAERPAAVGPLAKPRRWAR